MTTLGQGQRFARIGTAALAVVLGGIGLLAAPGGASVRAGGDLSTVKLKKLDYTEGLLDTASLAFIDPQVIVGDTSTQALGPSYDPFVCGQEAGAITKNIVAGTRAQHDASTTSANTAVYAFKTSKQAQQYLAKLAKQAKPCTTFTLAQSTYTTDAPPKLPKLGDQLVSYRGTTDLQGQPVHFVQVFIRKGQFVNFMSAVTVNDLTDASIATVARDQVESTERLTKQK
jgi:hypothetical protein